MIDLNHIVDTLEADDLQIRVKNKGKKFKGYQITVIWGVGTRKEDHVSILVSRDQLDTGDIIERIMERRP